MYTIEKHLETLANNDDNAKLIYSIWNLNKTNLKKALGSIQLTFPHYSIHDYTHADTIIKNIELFLGQDRTKHLSATDAWLILMSAYTHDIGMIVFMKDMEKKMDTPEFKEDLKKKTQNNNDPDLAESAKLILSIITDGKDFEHEINEDPTEPNIQYVLKIKRAITLLGAELFRKIHHKQSKDIITGMNKSFYNEFNKFYSPDIPIRFLHTLGDIAYCHGVDFETVIDLLPKKSNGFCSDYMHPRFIACLLRLGDLLDVDDKRFNQFTKKVFEKKGVETSVLHEQKHASVTHLLVTPENIEVTVDCKEDERVFRIANQWFDWLKDEVQKQNKEWHQIRPFNFPGLAPTIPRNKVQVLFNGKKVESDLANLKFNISKEKVFEIFEGSALYDDPSFVFLREISQNAVDATKIQLWIDIKKGVYDFFLKKHLKRVYNLDTDNFTHSDILAHIKFPTDIPEEILENYRATLSISWSKDEKDVLIVEMVDRGQGINKATLLRMSSNVGESRSHDLEYLSLKNSLPFFLKPTGAFGLGLQSIFLVSQEFEVFSKSDNDHGWHIIFRSARNGDYISARKQTQLQNTGTTVRIKIPKNKFESLFFQSGSANDFDFDIFTDTIGNRYIYSMIYFIRRELLAQPFMTCTVMEKPITSFNKMKNGYSELAFKQSADFQLLTSINILADNEDSDPGFKRHVLLEFQAYEYIKKKIGSQVRIKFVDDFIYGHSAMNQYRDPKYSSFFSVRNLEIKDNNRRYFYTQFCGVNINFLNPDSDKLLNIARNKIIEKGKRHYVNVFFSEIFPRILVEIKGLIESNFSNVGDTQKNLDKLRLTYFSLKATFLLCSTIESAKEILAVPFDEKIFDKLTFPEYWFSRYSPTLTHRHVISATDFFAANDVIVVQLEENDVSKILEMSIDDVNGDHEEYKKAFKKVYNSKDITSNTLVVWTDLVEVYLMMYYTVTGFCINRPRKLIYGLKITKSKNSNFMYVQLEKNELETYFNDFFYTKTYRSRSRLSLHPLNLYKDLAVKKLPQEGANSMPAYCNHCIISPFAGITEFLRVRREVSTIISIESKLREVVRTKYVNELIRKSLIDHIIANSTLAEKPDVASIKNSYVDLITDMLYNSKSNKKLNEQQQKISQ